MKNKSQIIHWMVIVFIYSVSLTFASNIQYTHDNLHRLTKVQYDDGKTIAYTYDAVGNRTQVDQKQNGISLMITTTAISAIKSDSAIGGGNITAQGSVTVTARGVCWSKSPNPTTANSKTIDGSGRGSFTSNITGLTPDTTYYVRAYATNSTATLYGEEVYFKTAADSTADTDKDGMPDAWETAHGLNPNLNDAAQDKDKDGYTNIQEYEVDTDPSDASSKPALAINVNTYLLLKENTLPFYIPSDARIRITGSASSNTVSIEAGANVQFRNSVSNNRVIIKEDATYFTIHRSGFTVYLRSSNGTLISIIAKTTAQSIYFNDGLANLVISNNAIMLGTQEITASEMNLQSPNNDNRPIYPAVILNPENINGYLTMTDSSSANYTISHGLYFSVMGSAGVNTIKVNSGAKLECVNFVGKNVINIADASSEFKVYRSGATVYFENVAKGTSLKMPATTTIQTLNFSDKSLELSIINNKVILSDEINTRMILDDQEITLTKRASLIFSA